MHLRWFLLIGTIGVGLLTLVSCGTELELYQWQRVVLENLDTNGERVLGSGESVPLNRFAIRAQLNPQPIGSLRSSDWIPAGSNIQSSELLSRIEVKSNLGLSDNIPADSLLNEFFTAEIPGLSERMSVTELAQRLGEAGSRIDDHFVLYPLANFPIERPTQNFTVALYTRRGTILSASTFTVILE